jgi:hypothetical protein
MTASAPRLCVSLLQALERVDDGTLPIAEIWRRVCATADDIGAPRPSYERVRVLVLRNRAWKAPSVAGTLVDVAFRVRPPEAVVEALADAAAASARPK